MGKQSFRRNKQRKPPVARVSAGVQQAIAETPAPEQILPVVQKLSSPDATERAWAAACVSNLMLSGPSVRKLLLSKGVIPILIQHLSDDQQEVVEESLGALRNMVTVDPNVAKEYYTRDILAPLSAMLPKITHIINLTLSDAPFEDEADQHRRNTVWEVAENFIYLIWSICEASDKFIKSVNRMDIITFLISFLTSAERCPTRTVIAAGQCLTTLTDDNKDIYIEFQNHPEYIRMLLDILSKYNTPEKSLVGVLACAILMNVREAITSDSWEDAADNSGELNKTLLPVLLNALDYDIQEAASKALAAVQSGNVKKDEEDSSEITPKPKQPLTREEVYVQGVEERLSTLQLSLELLADICIQDESEEDGWEDAGEDMEEDEGEEGEEEEVTEENVDQYLNDAAAVAGGNSEAVDESQIRSNPVLNMFIQQVIPQLIRLATLTPLSFPQEQIAPSLSEAFAVTHQRALECFNNFLLSMNDVPSKFWFKESSDAAQAWRWLFQTANTVGATPASETRDDMIEVIVGCLWALGRGLGQAIPLESSDVTSLLGAYQATTADSLRVKIVGCLGTIAMRQGHIDVNKEIGLFFMNVLNNIKTKQTSAAVAVEVLNCIYDVYSDCAFDYDEPVFVQGGFLAQLKEIQPAYRAMVKAVDRRKMFDLRSRSDEALANLVAFIKYKATERQ